MQRLEGVVDLNRYSNTDELKRYALFFDKLHVIEADILHASFLAGESYILGDVERTQVELRYLWEKEFVKYTSPYNYLNIFQHTKAPDGTDYFDEFFDSSIDFSKIQQKRYQQPSSHGSAHMRTQANLVKMRDKRKRPEFPSGAGVGLDLSMGSWIRQSQQEFNVEFANADPLARSAGLWS
jgi:hypothetical protein